MEQNEINPNFMDLRNGTDCRYSALYIASDAGYDDIVNLLLEKGAYPNIISCKGDTPLHTCANSNIAKMLINHGADTSIKNSERDIPLNKWEHDADYDISECRKAYPLKGYFECEKDYPASVAIGIFHNILSTHEFRGLWLSGMYKDHDEL